MKENAKLYKDKRQRTVHIPSKRLQNEEVKDDQLMQDVGGADKKKKSWRRNRLDHPNPP